MKRILAGVLVLLAWFFVSCSEDGSNASQPIGFAPSTVMTEVDASQGIPDPFPGEPALPEIDTVESSELGLGGGRIIITGQKFVPVKSVKVSIGGVEVTEMIEVSPTRIVAIAPPAPALGYVSVTVTTAKGSVTFEDALWYSPPEVVGYLGGHEDMEAIGLIPASGGLVVAWKRCDGKDGVYRFDLMSLMDPANPVTVATYTDLPSLVGAGLADPEVLEWAADYPGALFPHDEACCVYEQGDPIEYNGAICPTGCYNNNPTVQGNVEIHGGVHILAPKGGDSAVDFSGSSGIYNNYQADPPEFPELSLNDILPEIDLESGYTLEPKVLVQDGTVVNSYDEPLGTFYPTITWTQADKQIDVAGIVISDTFSTSFPTIYEVPDIYDTLPQPAYQQIPTGECAVELPWDVRDGSLGLTTNYRNGVNVLDVTEFDSPVTLGEALLPDGAAGISAKEIDREYGLVITFNRQSAISEIWPLDINDPSAPVFGAPIYMEFQRLSYPNLVHDGRWAWMSYFYREASVPQPRARDPLALMDWSDITSPRIMGITEIVGKPYDMVLIGSHIYAAQGEAGLMIVDTHR